MHPPPPDDVILRPMRADEWDGWIAQQAAGYVDQLVNMGGYTQTDAEAKAVSDDETLLPDGMATAGHRFLIAEEGSTPGHEVAWLWLGPGDDPSTPDTVWVYDLEVGANERGRGYGRAVMVLAEAAARAMGGTLIMLNVFAGNDVAIALYDSLGYEVIEIRPSGQNMRKAL